MRMEKVFEAKIQKKPGYLYFLDKQMNVCCVPMHPKQVKNSRKRVISKTSLTRDPQYLYILDKDGDVSRYKITGRNKNA